MTEPSFLPHFPGSLESFQAEVPPTQDFDVRDMSLDVSGEVLRPEVCAVQQSMESRLYDTVFPSSASEWCLGEMITELGHFNNDTFSEDEPESYDQAWGHVEEETDLRLGIVTNDHPFLTYGFPLADNHINLTSHSPHRCGYCGLYPNVECTSMESQLLNAELNSWNIVPPFTLGSWSLHSTGGADFQAISDSYIPTQSFIVNAPVLPHFEEAAFGIWHGAFNGAAPSHEPRDRQHAVRFDEPITSLQTIMELAGIRTQAPCDQEEEQPNTDAARSWSDETNATIIEPATSEDAQYEGGPFAAKDY